MKTKNRGINEEKHEREKGKTRRERGGGLLMTIKRLRKIISTVNNKKKHTNTHLYAHPHVRVMITKDAG